MRTVFLFLFFLGFGLNPLLLAQGQILCMNGREIQAGFLDFKPAAGVVYYQKKAGKAPLKPFLPILFFHSPTQTANPFCTGKTAPSEILNSLKTKPVLLCSDDGLPEKTTNPYIPTSVVACLVPRPLS